MSLPNSGWVHQEGPMDNCICVNCFDKSRGNFISSDLKKKIVRGDIRHLYLHTEVQIEYNSHIKNIATIPIYTFNHLACAIIFIISLSSESGIYNCIC